VTGLAAIPATLIDTVRNVDTPEGCRISLRVAGPVSRARAWLIDFLIRAGVYLTVGQFLAFFGKIGGGVVLIMLFALEWLYPTLFEAYWRGATPGKYLCKLAVLHDNGTPIGIGASLIRNTLRAIDFFPVFYGVGAVTMFLTKDYKRLGDLAAGTVVVYCDEPVPPKPDRSSDSEPPSIPLTVPEQRAIIEYTLRAGQLTQERSAELAVLATPLTAGMTADHARERLLRIGRFLLGKR
jgi:uncharacterized RDD family membrane protein YckC